MAASRVTHPDQNPDQDGIDPAVGRLTREFLAGLAASGGPPLETLPPDDARAVLTAVQASVAVDLPPADVSRRSIAVDGRDVPLVIVRPAGAAGPLPAFLFLHGGGWVLGDYPTHERLVRDLVAGSGATAVFVEYDRSPEVRFPVALEQAYAALAWVATHGGEIGVDPSRLAVVGNSVGGNLTAAVALLAKRRSGPALRCQVLFWPVTDAAFDTASYERFRDGHFLTRGMMAWFWDCYLPDEAARADPLASPLRATAEDLRGLPPAVIQTAECDVLRDEGEAYGRALDAAGVEVVSLRVGGVIHDYGLLNPLAAVPAVRAALRQAAAELARRLR